MKGRPGPPPTVSKERAKLLSAQTRLAETKLAVLNGTLLPRARVRRIAFDLARTTREAVLAVASRVSAELAAETRADRIHARIEEELSKALVNVADAADKLASEEDRRHGGPHEGLEEHVESMGGGTQAAAEAGAPDPASKAQAHAKKAPRPVKRTRRAKR